MGQTTERDRSPWTITFRTRYDRADMTPRVMSPGMVVPGVPDQLAVGGTSVTVIWLYGYSGHAAVVERVEVWLR